MSLTPYRFDATTGDAMPNHEAISLKMACLAAAIKITPPLAPLTCRMAKHRRPSGMAAGR